MLGELWAQVTKKLKDNPFDNFMVGISMLEPVLYIPQVIQLFSVKNAVSLSLVTWIFYVLTSIIWFIWGLKRKLKPIWISQIVWLVIELLMIYGIIIY